MKSWLTGIFQNCRQGIQAQRSAGGFGKRCGNAACSVSTGACQALVVCSLQPSFRVANRHHRASIRRLARRCCIPLRTVSQSFTIRPANSVHSKVQKPSWAPLEATARQQLCGVAPRPLRQWSGPDAQTWKWPLGIGEIGLMKHRQTADISHGCGHRCLQQSSFSIFSIFRFFPVGPSNGVVVVLTESLDCLLSHQLLLTNVHSFVISVDQELEGSGVFVYLICM